MDTTYLLPGEERCVDFRDANGVPKVHYTYCSIRDKLFNCTCCTKNEAQRLCEDWLVKQDRCYISQKIRRGCLPTGKLLGGIRLSCLCFLGGVLFLCKKSFYIFLYPNQFLHFVPCLAVVRVSGFLLGQQLCELRIQLLDLRQLLKPCFVKGNFRRLVQSNFLPVSFQKGFAVPGFPISVFCGQ